MSTRRSRKRKHEETEDSENEIDISAPKPKKRKITHNQSPKKSKSKSKVNKKKANDENKEEDSENDQSINLSPKIRKSKRLSQQNKPNPKSKGRGRWKNKLTDDIDDDIDNINESASSIDVPSDDDSEFDPNNNNNNNRNKNKNQNKPKGKPLKPKRLPKKSPRSRSSPSSKRKRRVSISQSQSQRKRKTQSQSQKASQSQSTQQDDDDERWVIVQHTDRVKQMYTWLTSSVSWSTVKSKLKTWIEEENLDGHNDDEEHCAQLTLDIVNLILYCGGVRVWKLEDISDLELSSISDKEKKKFVKFLERALQVDYDDLESDQRIAGASSDSSDSSSSDGGHSADEKAEFEQDNNNNNKTKTKTKNKKRNKNRNKSASTIGEKVLDYDQMLWSNGSQKVQNTFLSRYNKLFELIGEALELNIFESDDWIIQIILEWLTYFSRNFRITQFRKLGTFTAFSLSNPLVKCISKNRKQKERLYNTYESIKRKEIDKQKKRNKRSSPLASRRGKDKNRNKRYIETKQLKDIKKNISEYKDKIANIEIHTDYIFEQIAVYKFYDCCDIIRCWVLEQIVKWTNYDPSTDSFLKEKYWQYLHYALQDKKSCKVRICGLKQLMELFDYQHKFHGKGYKRKIKRKKSPRKNGIIQEMDDDRLDPMRQNVLEPFWDRIRTPINTLLRDKNEIVVKTCIEFINILLRSDCLDADDGDGVLNYIFDENDDIRQAAAKFIYYDTFDEMAVLKSFGDQQEQQQQLQYQSDDDNKDDEKQQIKKDKIMFDKYEKMKDDIVELIQLMKDRVVDLNSKVNYLIDDEKKRIKQHNDGDDDDNGNDKDIFVKKNSLYRGYIQVADYIVQSMSNQLPVLREWNILFKVLCDADINDELEKERNITNKKNNNNNSSSDDNDNDNDVIEELTAKHLIDDDGQTILCYLILSCIKCVQNKLDKDCRNVNKPRGRQQKKKIEEQRENAIESLKTDVLQYIPQLLDRYQADIFKLYPIIQMISLIPINAFNGVKSKEYLTDILKNLKKKFIQHDTPFIDNNNYIDDINDNDDMDIDNNSNNVSQSQQSLNAADNDDDNNNNNLSDEQIEARNRKISQKQLKELQILIKKEINYDLNNQIGAVFCFLINEEYHHKDYSNRFLYDIVSNLTNNLENIIQSIDNKLKKGNNLSTEDALLADNDDDDDDNITSIDLIQSLYSNLHKQFSIKSNSICPQIKFTDSMENVLNNIYDNEMYDGNGFRISHILSQILQMEIGWQISALNFSDPDLDQIHHLSTAKQSLFKLLSYYINIFNKYILNNNNDNNDKLTLENILKLLEIIISIIETLSYFQKIQNQNQLCDEIFNNSSLDFMDPITGIENNNNQSILKKKLYFIFKYVYDLPISEDPFDPSAHTTTENLQIRYLLGAARLCFINPLYYIELGALIISLYHKPSIMIGRRDSIIKRIITELNNQNHELFEKILFRGIREIMINENVDMIIRRNIIEKISKSVSLIQGFNKLNRKYWKNYLSSMMNYILGNTDNIPKYFPFLHSLQFFIIRTLNRDKLQIWAEYRTLERKFPDDQYRINKNLWELQDQFRNKIKEFAENAQNAREMNLDDNQLENLDEQLSQMRITNIQKNNEQIQSQSQSLIAAPVPAQQQDIIMNVHISDDDDDKDNDDNKDNNDQNDIDNQNNDPHDDQKDDLNDDGRDDNIGQRISVSTTALRKNKNKQKKRSDKEEDDIDDDDEDDTNNNDDNNVNINGVRQRVSVSTVKHRKKKDNNDDDDDDDDIDIDIDIDMQDDDDNDDNDDQRQSTITTSKPKKTTSPTKNRKRGRWLSKK